MTQRERSLLRVLVVIVALGGGLFLIYQWFLAPMQDYDRNIARLEDETGTKLDQLDVIRKGKKDLARWRVMGLPSDPNVAALEYSKFLQTLLTSSQLRVEEFTSSEPKVAAAPGKKPSYTPYTVDVKARGELSALARALEKFQRTPLLHRVKKLTLSRPEGGKESGKGLAIHMTVEALIVNGSEKRGSELLGPEQKKVMVAAAPSRSYGDMARQSIFQGAPPPKLVKEPNPEEDRRILEHVILDSITLADRETEKFRNKEAFLRIYYYKARDIKLCPSAGFDRFQVWDEEGKRVLVQGKVLRIDARDVYFQAKENIYGIHMGQSVADAMSRSLTAREIEALGLPGSKTRAENKTEKRDNTEQIGSGPR
jgi:hypothetical protein